MELFYLIVALIVIIVIGWLANRYIPFPTNIQRVLNVVLGLIIVGMGLWLINNYIPMAGAIRGLLNIVVFLAACVGVLQALGLWSRVVALWNDFIQGRVHSDHSHLSTP